ncbi:hypothetical protein BaRGS_00001099 [Batillaria attramentaria]|uniref:Uncharacterized protein n=1 Tax=Batillaria attramentaria TaxID=370345 RepID=A0ABD0M5Z1_9CAEN
MTDKWSHRQKKRKDIVVKEKMHNISEKARNMAGQHSDAGGVSRTAWPAEKKPLLSAAVDEGLSKEMDPSCQLRGNARAGPCLQTWQSTADTTNGGQGRSISPDSAEGRWQCLDQQTSTGHSLALKVTSTVVVWLAGGT